MSGCGYTKQIKKTSILLINYGYKFIGPRDGEMACGEYGKGIMSSPRQILIIFWKVLIIY